MFEPLRTIVANAPLTMSLRDVVFILGAGASAPFGFPVGSELAKQLYSPGALRNRFPQLRINDFGRAFKESGLLSIDRFLHFCHENKRTDFVEIGMATIASALMPAEGNSINRQLDWYGLLFDALTRFDDSSPAQIVTFNYDRSLEFLLSRALKATFGLGEEEAAQRLQKMVKVTHVYGQLGFLPSFEGPTVKYGESEQFHVAAESIRIIGRGAIASVAEILNQAEFLVFLGFGFLEENVDLLGIAGLQTKKIFASGMGISEGVRHSLISQMPQHKWVFGPRTMNAYDFLGAIDLFRHLKRPQSLNEYAEVRKYQLRVGEVSA